MSLDLVICCDSLKRPLTGIGYYTSHLLLELLENPSIDHLAGLGLKGHIDRHELRLLLKTLMSEQKNSSAPTHGSDISRRLIGAGKSLTDKVPGLSMLLRRLYLQRNGYLLRRNPTSLLHAPNYIPPPHRGPTVITVHDLSHIRHPETHPRERVAWLNEKLPAAIEQADKIICVSEFTRNELLDLGLTNNLDKLAVCYNGCDPGFQPRPMEETTPLLQRWGLSAGQYILSVATLEPRKNLDRLLDAYAALPQSLATAFPLVLAGSTGWKHSQLMERVAQINDRKVIVTGYLPRDSLQHLLSGASLFAYVSLYEGFGLPVVEAMASGTPVLCSASSALGEVAGNCGYTVEPTDIEAISEGMTKLLEDSALAEHYRQKALARAAGFTWQRCAEETVGVYKSILNNPGNH